MEQFVDALAIIFEATRASLPRQEPLPRWFWLKIVAWRLQREFRAPFQHAQMPALSFELQAPLRPFCSAAGV